MLHSVRVFYLFLVLLIPLLSTAQDGSPLLRKLTVSDGLPQGFISAIVQDSKGFIWIGTRNGLARYDGRKFRTFNYAPAGKGILSSGVISCMWLDKKDRLWITYESGHLDIFNTETEKVIPLTAKKEFFELKGLFKKGRAFVDAGGKYWILTTTGQLYIIDSGLTSLRQLPQNEPVQGIANTGKTIVLTTQKELVFLNNEGAISEKVAIPYERRRYDMVPLAQKDMSVIKRKDGRLALIDPDKIILYRPSDKRFSVIPLSHDNPNYFSASLRVLDNNGTAYFMLEGKGKFWPATSDRIIDRNIGVYGSPLLLDRSGVMWGGTGGLGIEQFDMRIGHLRCQPMKKDFHTDILKKAGVDDRCTDQFLDSISGYNWRWLQAKDEKLWVAQSQPTSRTQDVFYLNRNKKVIYPHWKFHGGLPKRTPTCAMAEDTSGTVWAIGFDMRLYTLDPATETITFRYQVPFNIGDPFQDSVNGLVVESDHFWISTTHGLIHYGISTGKIIRYFADAGVFSMLKDPVQKDILWIGTMYSGLIKFNARTSKYHAYSVANGVSGNAVSDILNDDAGNLWFNTEKGLASLAVNGNKIRLHSAKDENGPMEFNGDHYFKFRDGSLAYGGPYGYVIFDPLSILTDNYKPETLITSIFINNKELPAVNEYSDNGINGIQLLELPYDKNFLTFEFAANEYNTPESLQYRYMLKGLDKDWVYSGTDNTATYTTIPPGEYDLLINASNTAGEWSNTVKKVRVVIIPPFWRTWWFISVIVITGGTLLYLGIRRRIAITRRKDQQQLSFEREAIRLEAKALRSQMNPHFIFNCLNSIKALIHTNQKKEAVLYLTTFAKLLRNQLNSDLLEISLLDELQTCELYLELESLRFGEKLQYEFILDSNLDCRDIKIPALLLQPFIENAIIHGLLPKHEGGKITMSVTLVGDTVICKIDDDGVGRNSALKNTGHESKGMKMVQGRLNLYNQLHQQDAHIEIIDKRDNDLPSGTLVVITLYL